MACEKHTISSDIVGLRIAEEKCLGELPNNPIWLLRNPTSFADIGGSITTKEREIVTPTRQRKKGSVVDLDSNAGWSEELTMGSMTNLMQGFVYADALEGFTTAPMNGDKVTIEGVSEAASKYELEANAAPKVIPGDILIASGFSVAANNGFKVVDSVSGDDIVIDGSLLDEGAGNGVLTRIGFKFLEDDVTFSGGAGLIEISSTLQDMTKLGLIPGQWVYIGGKTANTYFNSYKGFARVSGVSLNSIILDKIDGKNLAQDSGEGISLELYIGTIVQNADDPDFIKQRSYHIERTLGKDKDGTMAQYVTGATPNELTINIPGQDLCTMDLSFMGTGSKVVSGAQGLLAGSRPSLVEGGAINTSSDFSRIKFSKDEDTATAEPLFIFAQDMTITINNNANTDKAIGVLGAIGVSAGLFDVGGSITAYFANTKAIDAVINNTSLTFDCILAKEGQAIILDIPHLTVSNGMPNVASGSSITLPLEIAALESKFGTTLSWQFFKYVPIEG